MDRRLLTVLGVSLLFALLASSVFYQLITKSSGGPKPAVLPVVATKDLVVASKALPIGATIRPVDVKVVKFPSEQYPRGGFSKLDEVLGRPVNREIMADEAVLDGRLAPRGSGLGLAPMIPVGMRAVTVRINDVVGVAGYVLPGLRVDLLVTGRPPNTNETITRTVLQNILVLSTGQTLQPDQRGQAINAPTVTLLASPAQAEVLTMANNEGRIQLVLRNGSDQGIEKTSGVQLAEMYGQQAKAAPEAAAPRPRRQMVVAPPLPPTPPPTQEIVVYRGATRAVEVVGASRRSE